MGDRSAGACHTQREVTEGPGKEHRGTGGRGGGGGGAPALEGSHLPPPPPSHHPYGRTACSCAHQTTRRQRLRTVQLGPLRGAVSRRGRARAQPEVLVIMWNSSFAATLPADQAVQCRPKPSASPALPRSVPYNLHCRPPQSRVAVPCRSTEGGGGASYGVGHSVKN